MKSRTEWVLWACLALVWFTATQFYPLMEPDEGRYAEIPREMAASGDWLTPRLGGLKYFEKPPLQYWATATLYKAFGVNEWTARVWALGLSFLCLLVTFAWARRFYGEKAAVASLAVLGTSPMFILIGHLNVLDGAFTFWLTATIFSFTLAQTAPRSSPRERNWMLLAWFAAALAVLSKGLVAPVLAGLSLLVYSSTQRDWQVWRRLHIATGLPLFLAVAAPWFIAVSLHNPEFPKFFFLNEHFARFLTTVHKHAQPWWYFLPIAVLALLPWVTELRDSFARAWRHSGPVGEFKPLRFLLIYSAVTLVFFSISQSKLPPYILPIVPALAAVIGLTVADRSGSLRRAAWIGAATIGLVTLGLTLYSWRHYQPLPARFFIWETSAVGITGAMVLAVRGTASNLRNSLILVSGSMLAWQSLLVAAAPARSARDLVNEIRPQLTKHSMLYSVGHYRQSVPAYLGRTLTLVDYTGELEFGLQHESGSQSATLEDFKQRWCDGTDAIAFFKPHAWEDLARAGLPGQVIASDRHSTVVKRR